MVLRSDFKSQEMWKWEEVAQKMGGKPAEEVQ